jgi:hypothetical protein
MPVMRPTNGGWRGILVAGKSRRMKREDDDRMITCNTDL